MGQPIGDNGGKYGKTRENKGENDVKTYVEAGMFHGIIILVPKIMLGGLRLGSSKANMTLVYKLESLKVSFFFNTVPL